VGARTPFAASAIGLSRLPGAVFCATGPRGKAGPGTARLACIGRDRASFRVAHQFKGSEAPDVWFAELAGGFLDPGDGGDRAADEALCLLYTTVTRALKTCRALVREDAKALAALLARLDEAALDRSPARAGAAAAMAEMLRLALRASPDPELRRAA
jgi:hypothetical protein